MLKTAFRMLVEEGVIRNPKELATEGDVMEISGYDDTMLYQKMHWYVLNGRNKGLKELITCILVRKPASVVYIDPKPLPGASISVAEKRIEAMEKSSGRLEDFAGRCGLDPMWIFPVSLRKLSLIDEKSEIYVRKKGNLRSLKDSGTLVLKMIGSKTLYDIRLYSKRGSERKARQVLDSGRY